MDSGRRGADILTVGFAATVTLWSLLYVAAVPPGHRIVWIVIAAAMVACLFVAGFVLGRRAGRGPAGGAVLGAMIAAVSLIVLLGLPDIRAGIGSALLWLGGLLVAAAGLCALGAAVGVRNATPDDPGVWTSRLAWTVALTTLLMLTAGGVVTGLEAGLAVEGWLDNEGQFIVLFPISMMRRDVGTFVEHAHRLWGLLVGLSSIVLAVHLWRVEPRRWVRWLAIVVVLAVSLQGLLGGLRVILGVDDHTAVAVSFGVVHGVFAPVILASMVALASVTTAAWRRDVPPLERPTVRTDRLLSTLLVLGVLLQITLGTTFRHTEALADAPRGMLMGLLHGHSFIGSMLVVVLVLLAGVRAWGLYADERPVKLAGAATVNTMILQVILGVMAFIVVFRGMSNPGEPIPVAEVVFTSAHQVVGAVLLSASVGVWIWERRRLRL